PKPSVPQRPVGAADTLLDAGGPLLAADDEVPGGTAMLRPGQPLPMPPLRKAPRSTDTLPDVPEVTEPATPVGGDGKTAFLGPAAPAARHRGDRRRAVEGRLRCWRAGSGAQAGPGGDPRAKEDLPAAGHDAEGRAPAAQGRLRQAVRHPDGESARWRTDHLLG